jgi:hypothetical protein
MFISYRQCPKCNQEIQQLSSISQARADYTSKQSIKHKKLCRSCIATDVNNRRWSIQTNRDKQSERWKSNNPSKINGPWNKGIPRSIKDRDTIKESLKDRNTKGAFNPNYGNLKCYNIGNEFKKYSERVRVLTERNRYNIFGYDETIRGKTGESGKYQIDHIKSILQCWKESISVEDASSISNLQFITWQENLKRRIFK